jgi:hypothetical protein
MKLKITKIKEMHDALVKLDGYDVVVRVEDKDRIVSQSYQLSGKARWNIAKNISILGDRIERFSQVRNDLIKQISGGSGVIEASDSEKMGAFQKEIIAVLETEEDVDGILLIQKEGLNLDKNSIPATLLVAIESLIQE